MSRAAILVFADTETRGDLGRIANALTTALEFKESGDDVTLIFDGAGTKWVGELARPEHRLHSVFESVKDRVGGACGYCAKAFGVTEAVKESGVALLSEFRDHPSIRKLVAAGYEVITL